ncbi:Satratoxin biosynthesis protein [Paramyrothecium foliicola]|nr:Satratoxin biosynthesis protein [Paramyrothecium foliicola]
MAVAIKNVTSTTCGVEPRTDFSYEPVLITFLAIAGLFVLLRFAARIVTDMKLWWDDWLNFASMAACIAYSVRTITLKDGGLGREIWSVDFDNLSGQLKGYFTIILLFVAARLFNRLSYCLFYMRMFDQTSHKRLIWITLAATLLISVPLILTGILQCIPVSHTWNRLYEGDEGRCINIKPFLYVGFSLLIVNDFWLLMLPIPIVLRLNLSIRKKLMISTMFAMGCAVMVTGIYKYTLVDEYTSKANPTLTTVNMAKWAGIEIDLGVVCACLPSLPVLFKPIIRRITGTSSTASSSGWTPSGSGFSGFSSKKNASRHGSSVAAHDEERQIRKTVMIQQRGQVSESETYLPLHDDNMELKSMNHTKVTPWR